MSMHVHGKWSGPLIMAAMIGALLPPLAAAIHDRGVMVLASAALAAVVALMWQLTFERVRSRAHRWSWAAAAMVFAVLVPPEVPLWQQALAVSFGVVLGEQVFGGWGRNFLSPAAVALAFLLFSFTAASAGPSNMVLAIASAASGTALLAAGLISWRIIAGFAIAATVVAFASTGSLDAAWSPGGYVVFALVFLVCDPVAAASTNAGRWAYGALAGGLVILLGLAGSEPGSVNAAVFAALLASLLAPLVDRIVIEVHVWRRIRRHG
jgi:Na+-transporting NADH:ubiquinone oxidoreductase subunit B